jgi:hypothetical protein
LHQGIASLANQDILSCRSTPVSLYLALATMEQSAYLAGGTTGTVVMRTLNHSGAGGLQHPAAQPSTVQKRNLTPA